MCFIIMVQALIFKLKEMSLCWVFVVVLVCFVLFYLVFMRSYTPLYVKACLKSQTEIKLF